MKSFRIFYLHLLPIILLFSIQLNLSSQCVWTQVDFEGFEYSTTPPDLIPGTTYHSTPWSNGNHHSGSKYLYMNFVNGLSSGTVVYERSYTVCPNQQYQFSAWFKAVNNSTNNITVNIVDGSGVILDTWSGSTSSSSWLNFLSNVVVPTTTSLSFQLISDWAPGNNDMAFDDLSLSSCINSSFNEGIIEACESSNSINLLDSITSIYGQTGVWSGPSNLNNGSQGTFNPSIDSSGVYTYAFINGGSCTDSVAYFNINVIPTPVADSPINVTACGGYVLPALMNGNYFSTTGGAGLIPVGTNITSSQTIYVYAETGTTPNCSSENNFNVTINQVPAVNTPLNAVYCNGDPVLANSLTTVPSGGSFSWTNSVPSIGLVASGTGNIPAFTVVNLSNVPVTGIITVTPTLNGCVGNPIIFSILVNPTPTAPVSSGVQICPNSSATLSVTGGGAFEWYDVALGGNPLITGSTFSTPFLLVNTDYWVQTSVNGCVSPRTLVPVTIITLIANASANDTICDGDIASLSVSPNGGAYNYSWADPSNSVFSTIQNPIVNPNITSNYTVTVSDANGCVDVDTVMITVNPTPIVNAYASQTLICEGETVILTGTGAQTYIWDNGINNGVVFNPNHTNTYAVTGTNQYGCSGSDLITVDVVPHHELEIVGKITICQEPVDLKLNGTYMSYLWQDGSTDNSLTIFNPGIYSVEVTESIAGCTYFSEVEVLSDCLPSLYIPNAFTPDGDGKNDVFAAKSDLIEDFEMSIYNRWGNLLYKSEDINNGWNGADVNGNLSPVGVYVYTIRYSYLEGLVRIDKSATGQITLLK